MRQWGQIAAHAHGTFLGHNWMNSSIEETCQHLDDRSANSAETFGEHIRTKQEHAPDFGFRQRSAQPACMAPQQIHLQFGKMVARNADFRELAEAGVDAVDSHFFFEDLFDQLAGRVHTRQRGWCEADLPPSASNSVNFIEAEILP